MREVLDEMGDSQNVQCWTRCRKTYPRKTSLCQISAGIDMQSIVDTSFSVGFRVTGDRGHGDEGGKSEGGEEHVEVGECNECGLLK